MSDNSSSSPNATLLPPSSNIFIDFVIKCLDSGRFSFTAFTITSFLLIFPVCFYVIYLACQRRRTPAVTTSHSDLFTYHMVTLELITICGSFLCIVGQYLQLPILAMVGLAFMTFNLSGQYLFHVHTCIDRYLAVVHPIFYLGLKNSNGIRLRNIIIGCTWLFSILATGFMFLTDYTSMDIMAYLFPGFSLIIISFCSLSVLYVLIRPGPGDVVVGRHLVDQSKLRVFYFMVIILATMFMRFGSSILLYVLVSVTHLEGEGKCILIFIPLWFSLPSSLVSPVLFLHRAGKLPSCKKIWVRINPGQEMKVNEITMT